MVPLKEGNNEKLKTYYQCRFHSVVHFLKISRNKFPTIEVKDYEDLRTLVFENENVLKIQFAIENSDSSGPDINDLIKLENILTFILKFGKFRYVWSSGMKGIQVY